MKRAFYKLISLLVVMTVFVSFCMFQSTAVDSIEVSSLEKNSGGTAVFPSERIPDTPSENKALVTYECCEECGYNRTFTYYYGREITVQRYGYCSNDNQAFVCWVDGDGKEYYGGETLSFDSVNLKAKKIPLLLSSDEVLSFSNSDRYYHTDEFNGYYMSDADYKMMQRNITRVFGLGTLPTTGLLIALSTYHGWEWLGSCYGMSTLAFLQHYGVTDIIESENGIDSLSDFSNTADVVSKINYYQWSAAGSFLCENFALNKGSKIYSQQLKDLYETVSEGNIVLFTYYTGKIFESTGHTVLLTGAYTQADGTKVLVAYDCNYPTDYLNKEFEERFYINPDYTAISRGYSYPAYSLYELGAFNWTDDYSHFEPFNMDGKGSVAVWYSHFIKQIFRTARTAFEAVLGIEN